jgi:hypothetical protein
MNRPHITAAGTAARHRGFSAGIAVLRPSAPARVAGCRLMLYDFPTSGNARKVWLLLAELGLEYEHVPVPRARPRPDWYLELNPFGGVPAIRGLADASLVA